MLVKQKSQVAAGTVTEAVMVYLSSILEVDFLLLQTYLDSIIPLWKVCPLLLLLLRDQLRLMRRQPSSHGARELWAKIERYVLLVLVE